MFVVYFIISIFTSSSSFISLLNSFDPQGQYISASLMNATVQAQKKQIRKFQNLHQMLSLESFICCVFA